MFVSILLIWGGSFMPQMAMEHHMLADIIHNMGNQQEEEYNFWCNGVRCEDHAEYDGIPEDCTTEEEENSSCGFGLQQP